MREQIDGTLVFTGELARAGYRDDGQGMLRPDADPLIAEPLKDTSRAAPDLWPLWGAISRVLAHGCGKPRQLRRR